ncbi:MAG: hypothetical protein AAGC86_18085 [Pseudomonadota bacterium]
MTLRKLVQFVVNSGRMSAAMLLAAALLTASQEPVAASDDADLRLIVNRTDDAIEVYVAFPASLLPDQFGGIPPLLEPGAEGVDIDSLRVGDSTYSIVEWMTERSAARLDGLPVELEPLSVMVHPTDLEMPFETPPDAWNATAVCTAPPVGMLPIDALTVYSGFFLFRIDGTAALSFRLGDTAAPRTVWAADYWDWMPLRDGPVPVDDEGWIEIGEGPWAPALVGAPQALLVAALAALAILGTVGAIVSRRGSPNAGPQKHA